MKISHAVQILLSKLDEVVLSDSFQNIELQKRCQIICKPEKSSIFAPLLSNVLGYGVMVTLQILVLPFLVRVRVAQQKETHRVSFFCVVS